MFEVPPKSPHQLHPHPLASSFLFPPTHACAIRWLSATSHPQATCLMAPWPIANSHHITTTALRPLTSSDYTSLAPPPTYLGDRPIMAAHCLLPPRPLTTATNHPVAPPPIVVMMLVTLSTGERRPQLTSAIADHGGSPSTAAPAIDHRGQPPRRPASYCPMISPLRPLVSAALHSPHVKKGTAPYNM